jgi:hypothetical protein
VRVNSSSLLLLPSSLAKTRSVIAETMVITITRTVLHC